MLKKQPHHHRHQNHRLEKETLSTKVPRDLQSVIATGEKIFKNKLIYIPSVAKFRKLAFKAASGSKDSKEAFRKLEKVFIRTNRTLGRINKWAEKGTSELRKHDRSSDTAVPENLRLALAIPAHDVRNALTGLSGYFENLIDNLREKHGAEDYLDQILPKIEKDLALAKTLFHQIAYMLFDGDPHYACKIPWQDISVYAPKKDLYTVHYAAGDHKKKDIRLFLHADSEIASVDSTDHFALHQFLRNAKRFASKSVHVKICNHDNCRVVAVVDDGPGVWSKPENSRKGLEDGKFGEALTGAKLARIFHHFSTSGGGVGLDSVLHSAQLSGDFPMVISKTNQGLAVSLPIKPSGELRQKISEDLIAKLIATYKPKTETGCTFLYINPDID